LTVSVVVTQTGGTQVALETGTTGVDVGLTGLEMVHGQSGSHVSFQVDASHDGKGIPVMVRVSEAVAVYVLVPWVKVVDSGQKVV
jgi:hypothetical protein